MFLVVFTTLILLVLIHILLAPILICIDTSTNQFYVQLWRSTKINLEADEKELLKIRAKVFFFESCFYPLKKRKVFKKKITTKKKAKLRQHFKLGLRILKSFKVKKFVLQVDTGNCIHNAKLYPLFTAINQFSNGCSINFVGRNQLVLKIQNRPIRIIKSIINL